MGSGENRSFVEEFRELIEEVKGKDPQKSKPVGKGVKTGLEVELEEKLEEENHRLEEEEEEMG